MYRFQNLPTILNHTMKCARYVSDAEKYKLCYSVWKFSMVKYFTVWILKKMLFHSHVETFIKFINMFKVQALYIKPAYRLGAPYEFWLQVTSNITNFSHKQKNNFFMLFLWDVTPSGLRR